MFGVPGQTRSSEAGVIITRTLIRFLPTDTDPPYRYRAASCWLPAPERGELDRHRWSLIFFAVRLRSGLPAAYRDRGR